MRGSTGAVHHVVHGHYTMLYRYSTPCCTHTVHHVVQIQYITLYMGSTSCCTDRVHHVTQMQYTMLCTDSTKLMVWSSRRGLTTHPSTHTPQHTLHLHRKAGQGHQLPSLPYPPPLPLSAHVWQPGWPNRSNGKSAVRALTSSPPPLRTYLAGPAQHP